MKLQHLGCRTSVITDVGVNSIVVEEELQIVKKAKGTDVTGLKALIPYRLDEISADRIVRLDPELLPPLGAEYVVHNLNMPQIISPYQVFPLYCGPPSRNRLIARNEWITTRHTSDRRIHELLTAHQLVALPLQEIRRLSIRVIRATPQKPVKWFVASINHRGSRPICSPLLDDLGELVGIARTERRIPFQGHNMRKMWELLPLHLEEIPVEYIQTRLRVAIECENHTHIE